MANWSDVVTVLENMSAVVGAYPAAGGIHHYYADVDIMGVSTVQMEVRNIDFERWVEFRCDVQDDENFDHVTWDEASKDFSRGLPVGGLCNVDGRMFVRHAVYLPGSDIHAISNGIAMTASAAYSAMTARSRR
jgi:hypothetical protein